MLSLYHQLKENRTKNPIYILLKRIYFSINDFGETIFLFFYSWFYRYKKVESGVNIIGFAKGDFGIAEHIRLVTHAIHSTEIEFCVNNAGKSGKHSDSNQELKPFIIRKNPFLINLFCYNADKILAYRNSYKGTVMERSHYNIGYGYWELSEYPIHWREQNKCLQELWAPSRFVKEVLERSTHLPVYYMPIPVDFIDPVGYSKRHFNLPEDCFLYLFTFDLSSFESRKNPDAVIGAFSNAFPVEKKDKVCLVLKINSIHTQPEHIKKIKELKESVQFDSRIILIDETLDRTSILGLIQTCDVYVSLHRSEGFGLGMAEAMKMGKVVIATHYSGNKDFMNEENSCPVKYSLVKVKQSDYCHVVEGAEWAEPDIAHAAYYMRKVYEDQAFSQKTGLAAKSYIEQHHSFNVIGKNYERRLSEILKGN
ncbi:MAG TPA: glycosyltransferase [Cytophagaceae bacterium]|nr:glycosyltransferase [Cytophagaceae bacterium]